MSGGTSRWTCYSRSSSLPFRSGSGIAEKWRLHGSSPTRIQSPALLRNLKVQLALQMRQRAGGKVLEHARGHFFFVPSFFCRGDPPISFTWTRIDHSELSPDVQINPVDDFSSVLTFSHLRSQSHSGSYRCRAQNRAGFDYRNIRLEVQGCIP